MGWARAAPSASPHHASSVLLGGLLGRTPRLPAEEQGLQPGIAFSWGASLPSTHAHSGLCAGCWRPWP